ncbi:MAG: beta-ketoacyl synthase N-terminal-like domain-containing protein, partial [Pseudomonadota bacterium]
IGVAGRFPRALDANSLWRLLAAGEVATGKVPPSRRGTSGAAHRNGGFLDDVAGFDPLFFRLSPAEAAMMDPQQRFFLMAAWHALEDAALAPDQLDGSRCGVFAGVLNSDYASLIEASDRHAEDRAQRMLGVANSILAARIAYHLDLRGPTVTLDTACSSSLVAVHLACRSLAAGDCDLALAGGVTLYLSDEPFNVMDEAGMLSRDGHCRPFDARADGIVPGEAAAVVVLKRLTDAERDGDPILGVIRATGINGDGRTSGITAPNGDAQAALVESVWQQSGRSPADCGYVEAHGTGTRLGDPIEFAALTEVFARHGASGGTTSLGSAKANLGHTSAAAGAVGLIKVLFALRNAAIPPVAGLDRENPLLGDVPSTPFAFTRSARPWPVVPGKRRVAAVSSFGFSGTNAHAVIEEAPTPKALPASIPAPHVVPLSARTQTALRGNAAGLLAYLTAEPAPLCDIAATLQRGRATFEERVAFVASETGELVTALTAFLDEPSTARYRGGATPSSPPATNADTLAVAFAGGASVNWAQHGAVAHGGRRIAGLPGYAFDCAPYWVTPIENTAPMLDPADPLVADHRLNGRPVLPGAAAIAQLAGGPLPVRLDRVHWLRPLVVDRRRSLERRETSEGRTELVVGTECSSIAEAEVTRAVPSDVASVDLAAICARCPDSVDGEALYARFASAGLDYGPFFRTLERAHRGNGEVLADIAATLGTTEGVHSGLIDGAIQAIAALHADQASPLRPMMPTSAETVTVLRPLPAKVRAHIVERGKDRYDVTLCDRAGTPSVVIHDLLLREPNLALTMPLRLFAPRWRPAGRAASDEKSDGPVVIIHPPHASDLAEAIAARHQGALQLDTSDAGWEARLGAPARLYALSGIFPADQLLDRDALDRAERQGVYTLFNALQCIDRTGWRAAGTHLTVVTDRAEALPEDKTLRPLGAGVIGLAMSAEREFPALKVSCVDVD